MHWELNALKWLQDGRKAAKPTARRTQGISIPKNIIGW
jgi:hypothetical protein